ncbi:hypothetical protein D3C76_1600250 [compost metagenome]
MAANVMKDLVVRPLHERGIHRVHRLQAFHRHGGAHRGGMLLGDADVDHAAGKTFAEFDQPGTARHRRGHGYDAFVLLGQLD